MTILRKAAQLRLRQFPSRHSPGSTVLHSGAQVGDFSDEAPNDRTIPAALHTIHVEGRRQAASGPGRDGCCCCLWMLPGEGHGECKGKRSSFSNAVLREREAVHKLVLAEDQMLLGGCNPNPVLDLEADAMDRVVCTDD